VDLLLANPTGNEHTNHGEFASEMIKRITFAYDLAREVLGQTALQAKRYYDLRVKPQTFNIGDSVLVHYPGRRRQSHPKWQRTFGTEAEVVARVNDVTYIVQFTRTRQRKLAHVEKLKLLHRVSEATGGEDSPNR
jgi:hypothetical protein